MSINIRCRLKFIFVISESPWGSTLPSTALRLASRVLESDHELTVFFREDGVYNIMQGTASDSGVADLAASWEDLGRNQAAKLLVCQASAARRLGEDPTLPFQSSGLVTLADLLADCDRVITF